MASPTFVLWNGATAALSAKLAAAATGNNAIKTMLQIKPGTPKIRIVEWGYSFDAVPASPVPVELITTGTVFATVTAAASGDVVKYNDVTGSASQISLGTTASGYTASAEGTITSTRLLAEQLENGVYFKQQFPLGREPEVNGGDALRIRVHTPSVMNMTCYVCWEE